MPTVTVKSTDLLGRVREALHHVRIERGPIVVRTCSAPQAVLIPYGDFQAYQR